MNDHSQLEDLDVYLLGGLEGEEKHALETHLSTCSDCRRKLAEARGLLAPHRLAGRGAADASEFFGDPRHDALYVPDELGQLDQAVAVGVSFVKRIEQRPGEDAVALPRRAD